MITTKTLKGVDLFHGDIPVDFHALKTAGVAYVFLKASQGVSGLDPAYKDFYARAKSVGLVVGAYHFFDSSGDAVQQAKHFLNAAALTTGDLVHVLDVETYGDGVGAKAHACAAEIERQTGRWPIIYSGQSFYQDNLKAYFPPHSHCLWIARYGHASDVLCSFWQDSESARIPGIPHALDSDVFYGDMPALLAHTL